MDKKNIEFKYLMLCAIIAAGAYLAFSVSFLQNLLPYFAAVFILVIALHFGRYQAIKLYACIFLASLILALLSVQKRNAVLMQATVYERHKPYTAEFTLPDKLKIVDSKDGNSIWISFLSEIDTLPVQVRFSLPKNARPPQSGDVWRLSGRLALDSASSHGFNSFWVVDKFSAAELVLPVEKRPFVCWLKRLKRELSRRIATGLDEDTDAVNLNCAILLGERGQISREYKRIFKDSGTIHIFAISGLHIGIIATLFFAIFLLTGLHIRLVGLLVIPLMWLYVMITGNAPSAIRAAAMASLCIGAMIAGRKPNGIIAWAITFIAVHIISPQSIINVGSLLSFTVVIFLIIASRIIRKADYVFLGKLFLMFVIWASGVPIVARVFGQMTPGGLVANIVLVPVLSLDLFFCVGSVIASFISHSLATLLNYGALASVFVMTTTSRAVASTPLSNVTIDKWSMPECLLWYAALGTLMWITNRNVKKRTLFWN